MGTGRERVERALDLRKQLTDCRPVRPPREVDRRRVPTVARAQPELVRRDRPNLTHEHERLDPSAERLKGLEGCGEVAPVDQILGLELVSRARDVIEPEMREAFVPRPGDAALDSACIGRIARDGMDIALRQPATEPLDGRRFADVGPVADVRQSRLQPDLVERRARPVGEPAHAVGARADLIEPFDERPKVHVLVHDLGDLEPRLDRKRHLDHDAEGSERHDGTGKPTITVRRGQSLDLTVGPNELERRHRTGEISVPVPRPVRPGRARAGHGDVRQRCQVRERKAAASSARLSSP